MYGVVEISGHQYKVQAGDVIDVQKLSLEAGSQIEFDQVLFIGGENPQVGLPLVDSAKVKAKVIRHDRARKIIVSVRKPGRYAKKNGHRQHFTSLLITDVVDGQGNASTIDKD